MLAAWAVALAPRPSAAEKAAGQRLAAHARARRWEDALALLRRLPEHGVAANTVHYNAAIHACARGGKWRAALALLAELAAPDEVSFTSAIASLTSAPAAVGVGEAEAMLSQMRARGLPPSTAAHNAALRVLSGAGETARAMELLAAMRAAREPPPDTITYNAMIAALGKVGRWEAALRLLEEAEASADARPDVVTYTSCMAAARRGGEWVLSLQLFARMRRAGVSPNDFSYATAISACDAGGQWVRGLQLLDDMRLAGHPPSVVACSAAISACAKAGAWTQALRLLLRMPAMGARPNIYSYNAAIAACTRASEWRAALALLRRMRTRRAPPPNTVSYNAAIAACARGGQWEHALGLLRQMRRDGVRRDGVSYNSALDALARRGRWEEAVALLARMARGAADGVRPDAIAVHSAVGACEAAGQWRSAVRLLEAAVRRGGGGALRAAGGSAVRACAAAGEARVAAALLEECERTLRVRLPPSAYAAVREAASRGAPLAAEQYERLFKRGAQRPSAAPPKPRAGFVLEGAEVSCAHGENRSSASDIFLSPQPGGRVRTVDAAAEARAFVSTVRRRSAYAPLLAALPSTVARGRSRARQQLLLSQHAEKKAIAAQLSLDYPEPYAKLTHCMCLDCHECFKAASRVYARRIVCDDTRMRHVFEAGECSCGDSWRTPLRAKET